MSARNRFYVDTKVEEVAQTNAFTDLVQNYMAYAVPAEALKKEARIRALLSSEATKRAGMQMLESLADNQVDLLKAAADLYGKEVSAKPLRDANFTSYLSTASGHAQKFAELDQRAKEASLGARVDVEKIKGDIAIEGVKGGNLNTQAWKDLESHWTRQIGDMARIDVSTPAGQDIWVGKLGEMEKLIDGSALSPEQKRSARDRARDMVGTAALPDATAKAKLVAVANAVLPSRAINEAYVAPPMGMSGPDKANADPLDFLTRATGTYLSSGAAERSGIPAKETSADAAAKIGTDIAGGDTTQPLIQQLLDTAKKLADERGQLASDMNKPTDQFKGLGDFSERLGGKGGKGEFAFDPATGTWDSSLETAQKQRKAQRKAKKATDGFELKAER